MHVSLLQGAAGSDPGAGRATGGAAKAHPDAASPAAFRALVDVLAHGVFQAGAAAPAGTPGDAQADDAQALPDGQPGAGEPPALPAHSSAAPVLAAIVAGQAGAPARAADEAAGSGAVEEGSGRKRPAESPATTVPGGRREHETDGTGESVPVAIWTAELTNLAAPRGGDAPGDATNNGPAAGEETAAGNKPAPGNRPDAANGRGAGGGVAAGHGRGAGLDVAAGDGPVAGTRHIAPHDAGRPTANPSNSLAPGGHTTAAVAASELQDQAIAGAAEAPATAAERSAAFQRAIAVAAMDAARPAATRAESTPAHSMPAVAQQAEAPVGSAASATPRPAAPVDTLLKPAAASSRSDVAGSASIVAPHLVMAGGTLQVSGLLVSAAHAGPAAELDGVPDTTAAQIVQTLRLVASGAGGDAHITLDPSHFGELTVSVRVEHGQVVARMQAESPVVREWLQANQGTLRQQLAEQHLTLDRLDVGEPDESGSASSQRRHDGEQQRANDERRHARRHPAPEPDARFEVVA